MDIAEQDEILQVALLTHLLERHPSIQLRVCDLALELSVAPTDLGCEDEITRTVTELVRFGLVYMNGPCVLPTPAAAHAQRIFGRA